MAENTYLLYVVVLLLLPLLARWRWGLLTALIVVVLELALVPAVFYVLSANHLFPVLIDPQPPPEHIFGKIRRGQAAGYLELLIWGVVPGLAAIAGFTLAGVWSLGSALWRYFANRD